ncbi:uncharacterized protein RHO25_000346 [Cercospora beticola]|uniref:Uncharacterized protein n=1 Tax=Cercospora beticola TaxID=122368 RepID=A0ABZ0N8A8_CERBT|nr:hypothetical protein RHO25_000346 [Cercospora beticola]
MSSLNGLGLPGLAPDTGLSVTPLQPVVRTVEKDLLPKIDIIKPKELKYYVAAWNSLVPQDATDFIEPAASDRYKALPFGASISFLALLPSPGTVLPIRVRDEMSEVQIPAGARLSVRWEVMMGETNSSGVIQGCQLARPGASIDDVGAAYQIVEGSLFVPWPNPATTNNVPTGGNRLFQVDLIVSVWWPGIEIEKGAAPKIRKTKAEDKKPNEQPSWDKTTLTDTGTKLFEGVTPSTVNPTLFLRNMFDIAASDFAPKPGSPVDILLRPKEAISSVPRIVQSVVEQTPRVQIQAGLDVANYSKGLFRSLQSVLPDEFAHVDPKVTAVGLDVAEVLNSALSIPLAASINGCTTTKTMIPNAYEALPSFETVAGRMGGLAGTVPVGNLIGKIMARTDKLLFDANDKSGQPCKDRFKQLKTTADFAMSLIPIPSITAMRDGKTEDSVTITVKIQVDFQVPGSTQLIKLYLPTPSITLEMPQIPIPQIFMAWRHAEMKGNDIFWSLDPYCNARMGTAQQTTEHLRGLVTILEHTTQILPLDFMRTVPNGVPNFEMWRSLLETAKDIILGFNSKNGQTYSKYGTQGRDPMWPRCYKIDLNDHGWLEHNQEQHKDHGDSISAFLWLGAPSQKDNDWRLILTHDDTVQERGCICLPFTRPLEEYNLTSPKTRRNVWAFRAMSDKNLSVQDALVYNPYSVGPENGRLIGNGTQIGETEKSPGTWNDRIRSLVWVPGWENTFWRLNTNFKG